MKKPKPRNGAAAHPESNVLSALVQPAAREAPALAASVKNKAIRPAAAVIVTWSPAAEDTVPESLLSLIDDATTKHAKHRDGLWGMIGSEFSARTAMSTADLQREVAARAGYDLYVCSPGPEIEALYPNLWSHLQVAVPKSQSALKSVFKTRRWQFDALDALEPSVTFSTSHYYVGNARFWGQYQAFLQETVQDIRERGTKGAQKFLSQTASTGTTTPPISHWQLLIDRLLPVFLRLHGPGLKVARIPIPAAEQKMNSHLKRLREMKDVAHHTKSKWLASCWLSYRNTYLLNVAGRDWCERNLPLMTPAEIHFY
jgi:hypothetical protein